MISLAGGLPDTSTFPAESFAALMAQPGGDVDGARAAVRPDRGHGRGHGLHPRRSWPPRTRTSIPQDILVTTGGQQVIDLVCKTLIDPGDVIVAEAPTYPGAIPSFCAYQADVVQIGDGRATAC